MYTQATALISSSKPLLEPVIPPTTGWVAQWESASHVMRLSRVRFLVWPIPFSSYNIPSSLRLPTPPHLGCPPYMPLSMRVFLKKMPTFFLGWLYVPFHRRPLPCKRFYYRALLSFFFLEQLPALLLGPFCAMPPISLFLCNPGGKCGWKRRLRFAFDL